MRKGLAFADRTAVLFLGVAAGTAIGYAFATGGEGPRSEPAPTPVPTTPSPGQPAPAPAATAAMADARGFECALPFQQHLLQTVAAGEPVTVGVFGDSFGDGVWSALYRLLPAKDRFRVIKYSQQSTGFTRYASLNLEEHARAQLAADGPVDIAVISFGANDTQGVYAGGHAAPLMSAEWQRVIGERIDSFVGLMRSRGAMVYWIGLPKMRETRFDADISAMNAFYAARMKALRVPFIDTKPLSVDAAGEYAAYLPDPLTREPRLMRANDGVHMSMNGYVVITRALAERIRAYVEAARVMAGGGSALPVAPPPPPPAPPPPPPSSPAPARQETPRPEPRPAEPRQTEPRAAEPARAAPRPAEAKPKTVEGKPAATERPKPPVRIDPVVPSTPSAPDVIVAPPAPGNGVR